ncbi:MAG: T9SS type A sorting domain-containing protein [Bacteroidetes bacterium]|nr:T9SS type A sorting domain-containing protein [Bacteroidota bacterium]
MKKTIIQICSILITLLAIPHCGFTQIDLQKYCGTVQSTTTSASKIDTLVNGDSVIIIPTVFHVLTQGGAENISKSHIQRTLEILNQDFNSQNPDTFDIPAAFHPLRGNPKVEFRLARIDPQGNCTDGIDRAYTPYTAAYQNASLMSGFTWDHTKYMNVYVVKFIDAFSPMIFGVAYRASADSGQTDPPGLDILMVSYHALADGFNGLLPGQRGHILSHEIGHNLSLGHTFGSGPGCGDDDDVADTPLQDEASAGCPVFPHISCGNGPDGDMFNNMMDYSLCTNMFTQGQADRVRTCLARNEWRAALWTPANLAATGVDTILPLCQNAPVADFGYGNFAGWLCAGNPVQFYEAASVNATSYQWEFTGGIPAMSTDTFPSVVFPDSGYYSVKLIVSNSFGNDTILKMIRIEPAEVTYNSSNTESFEDTILNAQIAKWGLLGKKWSITNLAADSGTYSIKLDSSLYYLSTFFTHNFDLSQVPAPGRKLEFRVALGMSAGGLPINGGLRVTWKKPCVYDRTDMQGNPEYNSESNALHPEPGLLPDSLKTATTNVAFIPNSSQWKTIRLDIPDSLTGEVQIGFDWVNFTLTTKFKGIYIDNIKVLSGLVGLSENTFEMDWKLYPNPATNQLTIVLPNNLNEVTATISDITGKIIYKTANINSEKLEVSTTDFVDGVYLVQVQTSAFVSTRKLIVIK